MEVKERRHKIYATWLTSVKPKGITVLKHVVFYKAWKLQQSLQVISPSAVEASKVSHDLELIFILLFYIP